MSTPLIVDLAGRLGSNEVRRVFLASGYPPDLAKVKAEQSIARYKAHPEWEFFGAEINEQLVGTIGLERTATKQAKIRSIAVLEDFRSQGVGTKLIRSMWDKFTLEVLCAETDRDAVDFYRRLGFDIQSLGEKYPGTERFWCILRRGAHQ
jgi:ribosomal protein S18 acetylase RimI-like enzyme